MSTPITHQAAQEHINDLIREARRHDLRREAQRRHHDRKVRHVAVIFPAQSHFKLVPIRPLTEGSKR